MNALTRYRNILRMQRPDAFGIGFRVLFFILFCYTLYACFATGSLPLLACAESGGVFLLSFLPRLTKTEHTLLSRLLYIFLFFAAILGSIFGFYGKFTYYDVFVHLFSGVMLALTAAYFINKKGFALSRSFFIAACLLFTLAAAAAWEMYEFILFSVLKNTSFSYRALLAELGVAPAVQTAKAAMRANLTLSFGSMQTLIQNEYDTFCDIICALVAAGITAAFCAKKRKYLCRD